MSPWAKSAVLPSAASLAQWPSGLWGPYHSGPSKFPALIAGNPLENGRLASLIPLREAWFPVLPVLPCTLAQRDNTGRRCFLVQDKRCAKPPLGPVPQPRWYGGRWSAGKFQSPTLLPKPGLRQGSTVRYLHRHGLGYEHLAVLRLLPGAERRSGFLPASGRRSRCHFSVAEGNLPPEKQHGAGKAALPGFPHGGSLRRAP